MHGFESFFVADPDGSNKTVIKRSTTIPGEWEIGPHSVSVEELHGVAGAMSDGLGQPLTGGRYSKTIDTFDGPDVTFAPGVVADASDDTCTIASLTAWSRSKCEAYIAAVVIYAPLPPSP